MHSFPSVSASADIDGNGFVDWEEFTSFCIELGIISGKVSGESPPRQGVYTLG